MAEDIVWKTSEAGVDTVDKYVWVYIRAEGGASLFEFGRAVERHKLTARFWCTHSDGVVTVRVYEPYQCGSISEAAAKLIELCEKVERMITEYKEGAGK